MCPRSVGYRAANYSEVRGGCQQMTVIGPDFVKAPFRSRYDVDCIARSQIAGRRKFTSHEFDSVQETVGKWDEIPDFVFYVSQEKSPQL